MRDVDSFPPSVRVHDGKADAMASPAGKNAWVGARAWAWISLRV